MKISIPLTGVTAVHLPFKKTHRLFADSGSHQKHLWKIFFKVIIVQCLKDSIKIQRNLHSPSPIKRVYLAQAGEPSVQNQIPSLPTWSCRNNAVLPKAASLESLQLSRGTSALGCNSTRQNLSMQLKGYYSSNRQLACSKQSSGTRQQAVALGSFNLS